MSKQGFRVSAAVVTLALLLAAAVPGHAAPRALAAPESIVQGVWARVVQSLESGVARLLGVPDRSSAPAGKTMPARTTTQSGGSGTDPNSGPLIDPNG
jgi:hypothetical protein